MRKLATITLLTLTSLLFAGASSACRVQTVARPSTRRSI